MYDPADHYWIVAGNEVQVYASARFGYAPVADETYVAWRALGNAATVIDSEADLQGVLQAAGVPFGLAGYAEAKQIALATGGFTVTIAGQPLIFATDPAHQPLIEAEYERLSAANAPTSVEWPFATGFVGIASADFQAAAVQVADFYEATANTLAAIIAAITAGTITTTAQIDACAWPTNVSTTPA